MEAIIEAVAEQGIGIVAVSAGIWMLWYLVKHTVIRLSAVIDSLATNMKVFTDRVRGEHERIEGNHKNLQDQHNEMMINLKEITTTLGRINGYKKDNHG